MSPPPFERWNEQDVRENIIRPMLHTLGYGDEMVTTELPLKYERQFLGRKKPDKDPMLRGKADYIIEIDGRLRWVIEAKKPGEITDDDREQAYSYAMHPEVRALIFSVISGTHFEFYHTFEKPESGALLKFAFAESEINFNRLTSLVSPDALRNSYPRYILDTGKPLAAGLRSFAKVVSGHLIYTEAPKFVANFEGLTIHIKEGSVVRSQGGGILAIIKPGFPTKMHDEFAKAIAAQEFEISTDSETISTDPENPTIFRNRRFLTIPRGTAVPDMVTLNKSTIPEVEATAEAEVEVRAYLTGNKFNATLVAKTIVPATSLSFRICADLELVLG